MLVVHLDGVTVPSILMILGGTKRLVMVCCQLWLCAGSCDIRNNLLTWYVYNISKKLSTLANITPIFTHILPLVSCDMVCTLKQHI